MQSSDNEKLPYTRKILKDLNLMQLEQNLNQNGRDVISILPKDKKDLMKVLQRDTQFLRDRKIMDYSLFLSVEKVQSKGKQYTMSRTMFRSRNGDEMYHIGIIDYLQRWNAHKKTEQIFKSCVL